MKQTAVDWLIEKVNGQSTGLGMYGMNVRIDIPADIIQQAKEMQKEQMCDFVEYCQTEHSKYQETETSWIKELTIDDLFEKRYTK